VPLEEEEEEEEEEADRVTTYRLMLSLLKLVYSYEGLNCLIKYPNSLNRYVSAVRGSDSYWRSNNRTI
jgi:hypothetical protein